METATRSVVIVRVIVALQLPGAVGTGRHLWHLFPVNLRAQDTRTIVSWKFGHYYPTRHQTWDIVHSNEMIRRNENIIYTQCCDVWRVTGCVTCHISIRCETRGAGYVITTLHSPHSLTQTVSQPASSPTLTLRMSKCQFHFILFYENYALTDSDASLVFYWDSTLQL